MRHRERAEKTREAILEAATEAFREKGFLHCNLSEVAARAGVTKPTVYAHFGSKEALFDELVRYQFAQADEMDRVTFDPDVPVQTQLLELASRHMSLMQSEQAITFFRAVMAEMLRRPDWTQELFTSMPEKALVTFLHEAHKHGRLELSDPDLAAEYFWGLIKGPLFWPAVMGVPLSDDEEWARAVLEEAVEIFVSHYGPKGGKSPSDEQG